MGVVWFVFACSATSSNQVYIHAVIGENRQLVTDEPVEFEK